MSADALTALLEARVADLENRLEALYGAVRIHRDVEEVVEAFQEAFGDRIADLEHQVSRFNVRDAEVEETAAGLEALRRDMADATLRIETRLKALQTHRRRPRTGARS